MFYVGIDIAKKNHEASIIDFDGKILGKSISFSNSQAGCEKLISLLDKFEVDSSNVIIGMEATGHYWVSLYSYLSDLGFTVYVINPIQSSAFRKMYIRQTKNDSKDSFVIAQIMRFGEFSSTSLANEEQLEELEIKISTLLNQTNSVITTITGIGDVLGAIIIGEVGDISRFNSASQLVAYAGLDPSVNQSGDFAGTKTKISKRGSPYLRRAIWLAANTAAFRDPSLSIYYQSLKARGKHHLTAIGAVARKMCNIIFAVLRDNKPYVPKV